MGKETTTIHSIKDDILRVTYKGKRVEINLTQELNINENIINTQLKQQPSNYAFLCLLRDKAIRDRDKLEREKDIAYSKAWLFYKESNTRISNEVASHHAEINPKYISLSEKHGKACYTANKLISICKAYETKERIIQTLSANIRKQQ